MTILLLGYAGVVLALFWPILFPAEGMLVFGDDIHRSYHFFRQFFAETIRSGAFPWWNPYLFSGEPLIANPSVAFWYPVNWLFATLPYRYVFSWTIAFHVFWAMTGMFMLTRSWVSGLVFGLSGFFMGRIWEGHIELIAAASWMPWVVWAVMKRSVVWGGVSVAMQILAGYQTMALFTAITVLFISAIQSVRSKTFTPALRALLVFVLGAGLSALEIIPAREFLGRSIRTYDLPYSWAVFGSYTLRNLRQLIDPFVLGPPWAYTGPGPNYGELSAFIGRIPLVLAFLAMRKIRTWKTLSFAAIAAFGLWVSFGWNAPMDLNKFLWEVVPGYKLLRIPSRHLILFVFGMSALAGVGLASVRQKTVRVILTVMIAADMLWFAGRFITLRPDPATRHNPVLVAFLQKNLGLHRIVPNFNVGMGTRDALDFDAVMGYRMFSASGYDPAILRNYYEFAAAASGIANPDVQRSDVQIPYLLPGSRFTDFLSVKYILVPTWFDSVGSSGDVVLEENERDYWRLYENKSVLPRFYLVPSATVLPNRTDVAAAIRTGIVDPAETVLTTQNVPSDCPKGSPGTVRLTRYAPNEIRLETDTPCRAVLVTSDVFYPGWKAAIDGDATQIVEGNLAFRVLSVPAGRHTVIMWYDPGIFTLAAFITAGAALVCFLLQKRLVPMSIRRLYQYPGQNA